MSERRRKHDVVFDVAKRQQEELASLHVTLATAQAALDAARQEAAAEKANGLVLVDAVVGHSNHIKRLAAEVGQEAKRADAMQRSCEANYAEVVALRAAIARLQQEREGLIAAVDAAISDREYFHACERRAVAMLTQIAALVAEAIPAPIRREIIVDGRRHIIERSTISGLAVKGLVPDFGAGWSLFRYGTGNDPDVLVQNADVFTITSPITFISVPPTPPTETQEPTR